MKTKQIIIFNFLSKSFKIKKINKKEMLKLSPISFFSNYFLGILNMRVIFIIILYCYKKVDSKTSNFSKKGSHCYTNIKMQRIFVAIFYFDVTY